MSEKKYFAYLSFILGLMYAVPFCIVFMPMMKNYQINNVEHFLFIMFNIILSLLYGPMMMLFIKFYFGKNFYTILDAIINLCFFRNTPKAIELYKLSLEQLTNSNPQSKFQEKQIKENTIICYYGLMVCYAKIKDNETAKEYLEKYLELIPEKNREKAKNCLYKKYHLNEVLPEESYEKKVVKTGIKVLIITVIFSCLFCLFRSYFYPYPRITIVAETDNIQTANEIQELIGQDVDTIRIKDGVKYQIAIFDETREVTMRKSIELADSHLFNENISLRNSSYIFRHPDKVAKEMSKSLSKSINKLAPVISSKVEITIGKCSFKAKKCEPSFANVEINAFQNADKKNITRIVQNLLIGVVPDLPKKNIKIKFNLKDDCKNDVCKTCPTPYPISTDYYYTLAREYYQIGNFEKARQLLFEAEKRTHNYKTSIENMDKMQKLNNAIEKNPKDYNLYIQRGDLKNISEWSMFYFEQSITSDYYGAIKDYEKALELNPNADNVYTKLAFAYTECGYKKCEVCKLEKDKSDYIKAAQNYEKALKYSHNKSNVHELDYIYSQLGEIYAFHLNAPKKAIEYYSKISDIYAEPELKTPYPDGFFKTASNYPIKAISIANLYAQIGDYAKAINLLDNTIIKSKSNDTIQEANNLKFLYLWKSKQYKRSLKQTDNCSVWICKLIGIVF
ncbi:MAG: tetratricopeptide repeat protein [Candidatus Gastranaerophilaceae bacterium]